MNQEELLEEMRAAALAGEPAVVLELTSAGLEMGLEPETMLFGALIPALEEAGARFERGDFYVPEMLVAGRAMAGALSRTAPFRARNAAASDIVWLNAARVTQ